MVQRQANPACVRNDFSTRTLLPHYRLLTEFGSAVRLWLSALRQEAVFATYRLNEAEA
jgi:hypothetical protein